MHASAAPKEAEPVDLDALRDLVDLAEAGEKILLPNGLSLPEARTLLALPEHSFVTAFCWGSNQLERTSCASASSCDVAGSLFV